MAHPMHPAYGTATLALLAAAWMAMAPACASEAAGVGKGAAPKPAQRVAAYPAGSQVVNPNGSCLSFTGLEDAVIENIVIGPCGSHGIELHDSRNVTIRNVVIADTVESGIYVLGSTSIEITESRISGAVTGVNVIGSSDVRVSCNTIEDPRGPIPRGQLVQFNKVSGAGNRISCNVGRNRPGRGRPEDAISLYQSRGTPDSPIAVTYNLIVGGGPSQSGGGIMLGDDGGSHQLAKGNVLVEPGQYGIAVSSGDHMAIVANLVFSRRQAFTNVGIYAWNQYPHACHSIAIERNKVRWMSKTGQPNPYWNGENCGSIAGIESNEFSAELSPEIANARAPECACRREGRR